jgi:hypothetical protein
MPTKVTCRNRERIDLEQCGIGKVRQFDQLQGTSGRTGAPALMAFEQWNAMDLMYEFAQFFAQWRRECSHLGAG